MDRQDIIARLRENEAALRSRGVTHAALFGSRARGNARPDSDTDMMIAMAQTFVEGMSYDAFRDDLRTNYAVTRCLEIIPEASRRLPRELKARHPSITWKNNDTLAVIKSAIEESAKTALVFPKEFLYKLLAHE
jgi:predicted nucleotidyltransferase